VGQSGAYETVAVAEGASLADDNTAVIAAVADHEKLTLRTVVL
jgi:hypothetical protein